MQADSWSPPRPFDAWSKSSNHVAAVTPASEGKEAQLEVYFFQNEKRVPLWRSALVNRVCPTHALVTDDGQRAVTFDNWGGVGYGDDVLAFYGPNGLVKKYSLEEISSLSSDELRDARTTAGRFRLPHSTSSRHWRQDSIEILEREGDRWILNLWLEWERRWHVWDVATGAEEKITKKLLTACNEKGRNHALREIRSGKTGLGVYEFLGWLKRPEDKPLIVALLSDQQFGSGTIQSSTTESGVRRELLTYFSNSDKREMADRILSEWENKSVSNRQSDQKYNYLGQVDGVISITHPPKEKEGSLRIYLTSVTRTAEALQEEEIAHYLIADFSYMSSFAPKPTNELRFSLQGVSPGQYRALVIWDREAPYSKHEPRVIHPGKGDYISTASPVITVKSNSTSKVALSCTTLFGAVGK